MKNPAHPKFVGEAVPRSVTVPALQKVGFVRVHFLYLNPKICKYQIFSTDILPYRPGFKNQLMFPDVTV